MLLRRPTYPRPFSCAEGGAWHHHETRREQLQQRRNYIVLYVYNKTNRIPNYSLVCNLTGKQLKPLQSFVYRKPGGIHSCLRLPQMWYTNRRPLHTWTWNELMCCLVLLVGQTFLLSRAHTHHILLTFNKRGPSHLIVDNALTCFRVTVSPELRSLSQ